MENPEFQAIWNGWSLTLILPVFLSLTLSSSQNVGNQLHSVRAWEKKQVYKGIKNTYSRKLSF